MASDACKAGKIKLNDIVVKPSALVVIGNEIEVKRNGFNFSFKVLHILKSRVSAVLAAPCYQNITSEEELNKYKSWFVGKSGVEVRDKGTGRPTKRDRRQIEEFKDFDIFDGDGWGEEED
jgi:ribosome-associated heat shock protein Hsp15